LPAEALAKAGSRAVMQSCSRPDSCCSLRSFPGS